MAASRILPLKHKLADLEKKVETARVHQKHYEIARKHVKPIEDNLAPGQVLIFRDFVNQYNEDKKKNQQPYIRRPPSAPEWGREHHRLLG